MTDVQGHKWAKITFGGYLELPKQKVEQKVIGVKAPEIPAQDVQGAIVGEVIAGSPAEKGGILPGEVIKSFGGMTVNTWLDLMYVVAMSA